MNVVRRGKRTMIAAAAGLLLVAATLVALFVRTLDGSKVPLHARIVCAATNVSSTGAALGGWRVAVSKTGPNSHFWEWACWIEETNRSPDKTYLSVPLLKDTLDWDHTPETEEEHGILMGSGPGTIETGKVYRVIGAHAPPLPYANRLPKWIVRFPRVLRILPHPKPNYATSEWFEVKIPIDRNEAEGQTVSQ